MVRVFWGVFCSVMIVFGMATPVFSQEEGGGFIQTKDTQEKEKEKEEEGFSGGWSDSKEKEAKKSASGPNTTNDSPRVGALPRPKPEDPEAIVWSRVDWITTVTSAVGGTVAGVVGAVSLLWWSIDACAPEQSTLDCVDDHAFSTVIVSLVGAPLGGALAASIAGAGLGYEGRFWPAFGLGLAGSLVSLVPFTNISSSGTLENVLVGGIVLLVSVPMFSALGYYFSQKNAVRIGEGNALLEVSPQGEFRMGMPAVSVGQRTEGDRVVSMQVLWGRF